MAVVTINGKDVKAEDGTLILDAAKGAGIEIPTFCYHAKLSKLGSCRMCLVEIEGMRKLQPSCVTPVMDGMKIHTESPGVVNARKAQLEFLLINHPLDCPVCDQAGECDLQDLTYKFGSTSGRFRWDKRTFPKRDMGPAITKEMNRCIACRRCSRFSAEISGDYAITELNRGNELEMGTFCHTPIESEFAGNTIQLCPVGALTSSAFRFKARSWDLKGAETICPHCSVGCSITSESKYVSPAVTHLHQTKTLGSTPALNSSEVKILRNNTTEDKGVTEISICDRGRYGYHFINSEKRLTTPLVREGEKLVEATWEKAVSVVADRLAAVKDKHGADSIGGVTSGICTNEDGYIFQKFLRETVGTKNVDIARDYSIGHSSVRKLATMRAPLSDVKNADTILILGSSVSTDTPILSMTAGIAARMGGARLMTISSGENRLLTSRPERFNVSRGAEITAIGAITKAVIVGKLYVDVFGGERKKELDAISMGVNGIEFASLAEATGLSGADIEAVALNLSRASRGFIIFGDDILKSAEADDVVNSLYNLAQLLGYAGEKGRILYAPASGNVVGNVDVGASADGNGLDWSGMAKAALDDKLRALYIMGDDPAGTSLDRAGVEGALKKLDLLVVQDIFITKTAELADVVLPAVSYAEKSGTVTNLEGRVQAVNRSIRPLGESREDWKILSDIAARMGAAMDYSSVADISDEIANSVAGYADAAACKIGRDGIFAGGPKAGETCKAVEIKISPIDAGKEYPIQVVPGRDVFLSGTTAASDEGLLKLSSVPMVLIGEGSGRSLGIDNGDGIKIETKNGSLAAVAKVTNRVADGVVVVPVNHPDLDPRALFAGKAAGVPGKLAKA